MPGPWEAFYRGDWQGLWSLLIVPALFLLALPWLRPRSAGAEPRAARFLRVWAAVFAVATIVDPLAVGRAGAPMLPFVLLGDFRVFLLVLAVHDPDRPLAATIARAAAWTLVVPLVAWVVDGALRAVAGPLPDQVLWLAYECAFLLLALAWRARLASHAAPPMGFLRAVLAYVALYYALWALADVLILSGWDSGWALRVIPNQLYYGFWVPVVWALFFSPRYAATSSPVQARR